MEPSASANAGAPSLARALDDARALIASAWERNERPSYLLVQPRLCTRWSPSRSSANPLVAAPCGCSACWSSAPLASPTARSRWLNTMHYRQVGTTDLRISEIGFGTGDNAGLMVLGNHDERRAAVRRALDLGITYFDTSPDYGKGRAEVQLGEVLHELGAHPVITTKVEIMPEHLGMIALRVRESVEDSLRRLQLTSVDIVQIHNPPAASRDTRIRMWTPLTVADVLGVGGALEALRQLRNAGMRYLGLACEAAEPQAVKELLDTGEFSMINVWYNLLNPTADGTRVATLDGALDYGGIIEYAQHRGVGVAVIRPLAAGALTRQAQGLEGRHPLAFRSPWVARWTATCAKCARPVRSTSWCATTAAWPRPRTASCSSTRA